jgi:nitrilase
MAAVQMCSSHVVSENLLTAENLIQQAAKNGAKLIVLPEMFAVMGLASTDKVAEKEIFGNGKIQSFLADQAKKHRAWIVGGTIPIQGDDQKKIRAASIIFDDNGHFVSRYDKIHLFDVSLSEKETYQESETTEPGNEIVVVDTPFGKLGQAVCFDVRFPELFQQLRQKGAEIITLPSAFTVPTGEAHWEILARSRAIDNFSYVIGACQGGTHSNGRKTYGHSMIIGPWGEIIAQKEDATPGIIYATIDLQKVHTARKAIPF